MPLVPTRRTAKGAAELGAPDYVVLGMVGLGVRSGYDIKQTVESSIRFFWTISQAQIYPSLKRLERAGLVLGHAAPRGRRPRRDFAITPAGQAALREWLGRQEPIPFELRDAGMLKLFFADAQDPHDALSLLAAVRRRSAERLLDLSAIETAAPATADEGNEYPLLTLRMGIAFHQAIVEVCTDFERRAKSRQEAE
ncbi:MAG: transcriptional regulator PadR family protein [Solirubrobacterales bacterium]|nr:transcriptional regulator PadR family protein [Solirubrobacterales bacterium]